MDPINYEDKIRGVYATLYPHQVAVNVVAPGLAWCENNVTKGDWAYFNIQGDQYYFCFKQEIHAVEFGLRFI